MSQEAAMPKTKRPTQNPESLPTPAAGRMRSTLADPPFTPPRGEPEAGLGAESAGQSGDVSALDRDELEGPESVETLAEEGQDYEAELVAGVEDAPGPDQGGVRTHR